jgi:multidrug efflux system membrane fusion protein
MTAELRTVTVDRIEGPSAIVAAGLKPGEQVVTQGQLRLGPGSRVSVRAPAGAS